jgi:hypothetical protein
VITLVRVELTRLLWRRAVAVLVVLSVLAGAAVFAIRYFDTEPQSLEQIAAEYDPGVYEQVESCVELGRFQRTRADTREECEHAVAEAYSSNVSLDMSDERTEGGALAVMLLVALLMLLAGTTFAGHDWNTGSISNQLLFEPRRGRVWAAKALAVTVLGGLVSLAVGFAYWSAIWATVAVRDLPIREHALQLGYEQVLWGAGFGAACALFGYALTMLLRSTVGALGLLFAVMFLSVVVYGVFGLDDGGERFMPWGNFYAYAVGAYEYYDFGVCALSDEYGCESSQEVITRSVAVVYFGLVLLVTLVPSVLAFRERDLP